MKEDFDAVMEMPQFVNITIFTKGQDGGLGEKVKARINPFHISSYYQLRISSKENEFMITVAVVGATPYYVDMRIEEFDDMVANVERGMHLK